MGESNKGPESRIELVETRVEHTPSLEEVRAQLRELIRGEFKETRKKIDEKGLYLLEVEVNGEKEGEVKEYSYRRDVSPNKQREGTDASLYHSIDVTYYEHGVPVDGTDVA